MRTIAGRARSEAAGHRAAADRRRTQVGWKRCACENACLNGPEDWFNGADCKVAVDKTLAGARPRAPVVGARTNELTDAHGELTGAHGERTRATTDSDEHTRSPDGRDVSRDCDAQRSDRTNKRSATRTRSTARRVMVSGGSRQVAGTPGTAS